MGIFLPFGFTDLAPSWKGGMVLARFSYPHFCEFVSHVHTFQKELFIEAT